MVLLRVGQLVVGQKRRVQNTQSFATCSMLAQVCKVRPHSPLSRRFNSAHHLCAEHDQHDDIGAWRFIFSKCPRLRLNFMGGENLVHCCAQPYRCCVAARLKQRTDLLEIVGANLRWRHGSRSPVAADGRLKSRASAANWTVYFVFHTRSATTRSPCDIGRA